MAFDAPPCKVACPIQTDAREYVQLIAERRFAEAYDAIRRLNPLPRICGRICAHPCETSCKRGQVDEPVAIAKLKRFASDGPWKDQYKDSAPAKSTGRKVAVIGSGPGGLAAAHDLALLGHSVTIFEKLSVLGGMMAVGIPKYRIPSDVLTAEIKAIEDLGVEMKTGVAFGEDVTLQSLRGDGYEAFFVATGLHLSRRLNVEGEDLPGVLDGVGFLRDVALGRAVTLGKRVVVVGGGNVAIDVARTALRVGAQDVSMVCLEKAEEMPASEYETEEARKEGVAMVNCFGPKRFLEENGRLKGIEFRSCTCVFDEKGAFCPSYDETNLRAMEADTIIVAIGQAADLSFAQKDNIAVTPRGGLETDPATSHTPISGVFAGGDAVTGPGIAIGAIAAGKRAAISIDLYLRGESLPTTGPAEGVEPPRLSSAITERTRKFARCSETSLPVDDRLKGFDEAEAVLSEDLAIQEALRCLHCSLGARIENEKCVSCLTCVRVCPVGVPSTDTMGEITINPYACQACGMCALECPVRAIDISLDSRSEIAQDMEKAISVSPHKEPSIVVFLDLHGNFGSDDLETFKRQCPGVMPVLVFGLRRIDTTDVLKAFELGADGVVLAACPPQTDPFPEATDRAKRRMARGSALLEALGVGHSRLVICDMPEQGLVEKEVIDELAHMIKEAGQANFQ
jgi:NADPH-dependent glutamate synthase beta subunit-like oxidoreductase/coenzyme F420-reducing hydrogenase delta subunit